jgi:hypothetical protein
MHAPGASAPFTLKGIEHVLLLVDGLERSIAFYQDVIGARLETELPRYAMAELRAGDAPYVCDPSGNVIELMGEFS